MSPVCKRSCSNVRCPYRQKSGGKSRTPIGHLRSNVMTVLRRWFPQNDATDPSSSAAPTQFNCTIETLLYKLSRLGVYEGLARDYKLRIGESELDTDIKAIIASMKLKVSELRRMGACSCAGVRLAEDVYQTKKRMLCASRALRRSLISTIDQEYQPTEAMRFKICSIFSLLDEIEAGLKFTEMRHGDSNPTEDDRCMPAGDCLPVCPDALRRVESETTVVKKSKNQARAVTEKTLVETEDVRCEMDEIALGLCGTLKLPPMGPSMTRLMKRRIPIIQNAPCELAGLDITYTKMKRTIYETRKSDKREITEEDVIQNQVSFTLQPENPDQRISTSNVRLVYRTAETEIPRSLKNESNKEKLSMLSNVWLATARRLVEVYFDSKGSDNCCPCSTSE